MIPEFKENGEFSLAAQGKVKMASRHCQKGLS